ncbi:MAG: hypothetical protein MJ152_04275, partial [Clostridia bacterium]|nr:hypothetical protein [Clostridia bacterium]
MKKLKTFLTLSLCLVAMFMFVGCCGEEEQPTLSTPTNTTISNDKVVKFDVVANATYYVINVNGVNYYAYLNGTPQISTVDSKVNYDAKDIMHQNTTYVVKVKAGANGYKESEFGTKASFVNSVKLSKTSVEVIGTTATWETVENADYYNIKIVLPTDEENEGQANLVTYKVQGKNYFVWGWGIG